MKGGGRLDIGIGTTTVDKRCVDKQYVEKMRLEGVILKANTNATNPTFVFNVGAVDVGDLADVNYVHWFKMKRFYYCEVVFVGSLVELRCVLDPRRTWAKTIRQSEQFVDRQEKKFNKQLFDSEIALENGRDVSMIQFPTLVGDSTAVSRNYILMTNGKKENE